MKHLLKMLDLSGEEILEILDLADQLKYELKHSIPHPYLKGKSIGLIFQKASTRTRVSFETGMYQLGGHALFLSASDLQIGRGEPVQDTARVLSRYLNGIMIRTFEQKEVEDLAEYGSIPVINGLTDFSHPCQVLADLMTIRERKSTFDGLKMCFIGDGNNMANSLIVGGLKVILHIFDKAKGLICIEDNKPEAIAKMQEAVKDEDRIEVKVLKTKYPQGGERTLISAATGRKIYSAKLPADAGCIVDNVSTVIAIYRAVCKQTPLITRVVTLTGEAFNTPINVDVRIGCSHAELQFMNLATSKCHLV